ncbi:MAG: division/cell wall cluster transcriptional repressor MraZ [Acetobacteraceae bacterium]|nr:division/cell wall cluster transcriptional repressor MraZ [Acetobacteraceae bacterium]
MFRGQHEYSIDEKGRLVIPPRFREALGERFIITRGLDNCLWAYSAREWEVVEGKLRELLATRPDAAARAFVRFFSSGATECTFDRQGRVLLPAPLREYAEIKEEAVVIGVVSRVEIWSRERWQAYNAGLSPEAIAEKIVDLGI